MAEKTILLQNILKDSDYKQAQFNLFQIAELEKRIIAKTDKNGKDVPYIQCLVRKKEIRLSALIQESFSLRKESERLLVEAREMVEREIEDN